MRNWCWREVLRGECDGLRKEKDSGVELHGTIGKQGWSKGWGVCWRVLGENNFSLLRLQSRGGVHSELAAERLEGV